MGAIQNTATDSHTGTNSGNSEARDSSTGRQKQGEESKLTDARAAAVVHPTAARVGRIETCLAANVFMVPTGTRQQTALPNQPPYAWVSCLGFAYIY